MASKRTTRAIPAPETTTTTTSVTNAQLQAMINAALAARDATRNGDDSHTSGTGVRRTERVTRECTYQDFMKCQPLYFKGTEGVVELTQWFKRMETCALTWCNSYVRIVGQDVAYAMTWTDLRKKMTDKYCLRNEMKKLEVELWNLKVKEADKVERYVGGLPDMIQGSVVASKPKTMLEATEMASELMDKKINTIAKRQAKNKQKFDDISKNNQNHPQQNKRQNTSRAYAAGNDDKRPYEGPKPLCPKCNYHHDGPCTPRCNNRKKISHLAKDYRSRLATANNNNNNNNRRAQGANTNGITCYECRAPGYFKRDCPQWKNKNQGNDNGVARAYAVGVAGQNPNNNVVTGTFLLNNHCASILFDTSADRSFISTALSTLIDIIPTTLDHGYDVELADGKIIGVNTVLRGCTVNFLNHPVSLKILSQT
ncbi:putative reverse transcriptase domain-containing protein [Tanacetum coccineum]